MKGYKHTYNNDSWWKKILKDCDHRFDPVYTLYGAHVRAGGWRYKYMPDTDWAVIDLTGYEKPTQGIIEAQNSSGASAFAGTLGESRGTHTAPWLSLPIRDYQIPTWSKSVWKALARDVHKLLRTKTDVVIACLGGHGRTGLALGVLIGLIAKEHDPKTWEQIKANPVAWVRKVHCTHAVETEEQKKYIYEMLDLPYTVHKKALTTDTPAQYNSTAIPCMNCGAYTFYSDLSTCGVCGSAVCVDCAQAGLPGGEVVCNMCTIDPHVQTLIGYEGDWGVCKGCGIPIGDQDEFCAQCWGYIREH